MRFVLSATAPLLLSSLHSLLAWFQKNRLHTDRQIDEALDAINKALIASMKYVEECQSPTALDRSREFELAELWATASARVRHVSQDLATRLHDKSIYWRQPMKWSRDEVVNRKIDFESVQQEFAKLLLRK